MATNRLTALFIIATALVSPAPVRAFVLGGGPARTDCLAAWQATTADVTANHGKTGVDCQDGDPACDLDGKIDGVCTVGVSVCTGTAAAAGCTPDSVTELKLNRSAQRLGITVPSLPKAEAGCGTATVVSVALRQSRNGYRPSKPLVLGLNAKAASGRDRDVLRLRCVPNAGASQCPANAAGGPRELSMVVATSGTDLDNGVSGLSHNFPVPGFSRLRMCLSGCDTGGVSGCVQDQAATDAVQSATFGPPLPLLSAGVPVCIVNRFGSPSLTGGSADLASGAVSGDLHLLSDVYLTTLTQICPRCSASGVGGTGTCDSGRRAGQACRTESVLDVGQAPADGRRFALSSDCPPSGTPAGSLTLTLPLTTATATLPGPRPCGGPQDDACGAGTCTATCTGTACVATTPDGQCIDAKGGISQACCSTNTQLSCFPTRSGAGAVVRNGSTTTPAPAWPDPTYPKTGAATLAATFCEGATGSTVVDAVTGLPGPGALLLPIAQTFVP